MLFPLPFTFSPQVAQLTHTHIHTEAHTYTHTEGSRAFQTWRLGLIWGKESPFVDMMMPFSLHKQQSPVCKCEDLRG